jgi:signal transduction histidine kinase
MNPEQLLRDANRLRFPELIEREFQEAYYNVKAHQLITQWGLVPAFVILCMFWAGDFVGFTKNLDIICIIRILSLLPLIVMIITRRTKFMRQHIRNISSVYLFLLACTVLAIVAITPHTDYAHRGYILSFPMVIFIMFLAKPHLGIGIGVGVGFTVIFTAVNIVFNVMPLGHSELVSHVHINLVMVSSIVIGAVACYVLEAAERREFIRKKISEHDRETILLQQLELSDVMQEQLRLNQALNQQNKVLDTLNQEKNEFLGIAAHDLKNPLAGITLQTTTLKRYINRMSTDDVLKVAESIEGAATRMKDIVVNLLDVNAIETNQIQATPTNFDVCQLLRTLIEDYSKRAELKSITLILDTESPTVFCFADSSKCYQVFDNLLSNAIKFSSHHKNIFLRVRYNQNEQTTQIDIVDQGPGLTNEDKQLLFKKFQRLSSKPTGGENSTGLGLSIVLRLVEMMNGRIWCDSEVGQGTTFSVALPCGTITNKYRTVGHSSNSNVIY